MHPPSGRLGVLSAEGGLQAPSPARSLSRPSGRLSATIPGWWLSKLSLPLFPGIGKIKKAWYFYTGF